MRDRLIELKTKFVADFACGDCEPENEKCMDCLCGKEADYLLENGVIVPPCKVGDVLYDIHEFVEGVSSPEIYEVHARSIDVSRDEKGYIYCIDFNDYRDEDFGKTVFLTREEAERALEGGGGDD